MDKKLQDLLERGNAYVNKGEYDLAIADFNQVIELDSEFAMAFSNRGVAYNEKGEYDRAIKDYDQAIELNPKYAEAYYNRGNAYSDKGEYDLAIEDYNQAIKLKPEFAEAYYNRGNAYGKKGEYGRAIEDYDQAIELNPKYAEAYYNRGNAYSDKGEYDLAIADFNQAIKLDQKDAEAFNNRGNAYNKKGEYDRAIEDFDQAIELNPKCVKAFYNRGTAYRKIDDEDQAIADFKKANELDPTIIVTEEIKETKEATKKTEDFQEILGGLEKEFKVARNWWLGGSCLMVGITVIVILLLMHDMTNKECAKGYAYEDTYPYPLYIFLSAITAVVIRQYTNAKQLYTEARNRMAMAKMLAHIENRQTDKKQEFLSKIIDSIVYSTRKDQSSGELPSILEQIKKWLSKK